MKEMKSKYSGKIGMQYKYFSINSKEAQYDSEKRIITGYAAVFGNKDKAGDILIKDASPRVFRIEDRKVMQ